MKFLIKTLVLHVILCNVFESVLQKVIKIVASYYFIVAS